MTRRSQSRYWTRTYLILAIALVLIYGSSNPASAVIEISGYVSSDSTWTNEDTIIVTGDVIVSVGVLLEIEEGTIVLFNPYKALKVYGELSAIGSVTNRIVFASTGTSLWNGIQPKSGSVTTLRYCDIDRGQYGMRVDFGSADLYGCRITNFGYRGIYFYGTSNPPENVMTLRRCEFYHTDAFRQGSATGLYAYSDLTVDIDSCSFQGLQTGVMLHGCKYGAPEFTISCSEIQDHASTGIVITAYG